MFLRRLFEFRGRDDELGEPTSFISVTAILAAGAVAATATLVVVPAGLAGIISSRAWFGVLTPGDGPSSRFAERLWWGGYWFAGPSAGPIPRSPVQGAGSAPSAARLVA